MLAAIIQLITGSGLWLAISVALAVVLLWGVYRLRQTKLVQVPLPQMRLVTPDKKPPKCPGLIALVGPGRKDSDPLKQAALDAIEYHRFQPDEKTPCLRSVWLVSSEGARGGVPVAQLIKDKYEPLGIRVDINNTVKDPFSGFQETYDVVKKIIDDKIWISGESEIILSYNNIIADITGATVPMSIGTALACDKLVKMQYMFGNKSDIKSEPVLIQFEADKNRPGL